MKKFKGTRWYKCDLHLHTKASKCFNENISPKQWIDRVIEQGLDCIAVTDHNTSFGIDDIIKEAKDTQLTIFPGVEITCDTSKCHLLVLFNIDKTSEDVRDFLIKCHIERKVFGQQAAHTSKSIFEVAEIAAKMECIVIPAHVDVFNGLSSISFDNLNKFYSLEYINAIQVVHQDFLTSNLKIQNNKELVSRFNKLYSTPQPAIDESTIKSWYSPVRQGLSNNKAIVTFSDNPYSSNSSKHGLWGIGTQYTWIKMDEKPTLESLRQAFLLHDLRVRDNFRYKNFEFDFPSFWIKQIRVSNTKITEDKKQFVVDFSPQLTAIIGGRGSGKSSILRFLRGIFRRTNDIEVLENKSIIDDLNLFYQQWDNKSKKGVFNNDSLIEVFFERNNIDYKITVSNITGITNQQTIIEKLDINTNNYELINGDAFLDLFNFEIFSQKQIFEIAQSPNSLREQIDRSVPVIKKLNEIKRKLKIEYSEKAVSVRKIEQQVKEKERIAIEVKDLSEQIQAYENSSIKGLLNKRQSFISEEEKLTSFTESMKEKSSLFNELIEHLRNESLYFEKISEEHYFELNKISENAAKGFQAIFADIKTLKSKMDLIIANFEDEIKKSKWKKNYYENHHNIDEEKKKLMDKGVKSIDSFEDLIKSKNMKIKQLEDIRTLEKNLSSIVEEKKAIKEKYVNTLKDITSQRRQFVHEILKGEKVKISIKPFRNQIDYEFQIRQILQRDTEYSSSIDYMISKCFNGKVEDNLNLIFQDILLMKNGIVADGYDGYFKNAVERLNDKQIDEFDLLHPEDEI